MNHALKEKLHSLLSYYLSTRGVGHSRVLAQGLGKEPTVVLVGGAGRQFERIRGVIEIRWGSSLRFVGRHMPLAIDNSAMIDMLSEMLSYIHKLEAKLYRKQNLPITETSATLLMMLATYTNNSDPTWNPLESLDDAWGLVSLMKNEEEATAKVFWENFSRLPVKIESNELALAICRAAADAWGLKV